MTGVVAHVGMAEPFCPPLSQAAFRGANDAGAPVHAAGTYICIEGPAFGTRAESHLYRGWGADIVGMTAIPEAKLAREAELCYALVAAVTDYDSWHESEGAVDAKTVFAVLAENVGRARAMVRNLAANLPAPGGCDCGVALDAALVTAPEAITPEARARLGPILSRRLGGSS